MCSIEIRVALLDDHPLMLMGINSQLQQEANINVVIASTLASDFFNRLKNTKVDLAILDIIMPNMSGIEVAKIIKENYPDIKLLMLSSENNPDIIKELIEINVDGFISKLSPINELIKAIDWIASGGTYYGTDIAKIIDGVCNAKFSKEIDFSQRELDIIRLSSQGLMAKQIAINLGISNRTVETHKSNIFKKLGIRSTSELILYGLKQGIIKL